MMAKLWRGLGQLLGALLIAPVRVYQFLIRPWLPPVCRFTPGCSEYFILSVKKHGPIIGCVKGTWRICRCNPLFPGGYDPP